MPSEQLPDPFRMETEAEAGGGGGGGGGSGGGGAGACAGAGGGAGVPLALGVGEGDEGEGETATLGLPAGLCAVDALLQAATAKTSNKQHNALQPLTAGQTTPLTFQLPGLPVAAEARPFCGGRYCRPLGTGLACASRDRDTEEPEHASQKPGRAAP